MMVSVGCQAPGKVGGLKGLIDYRRCQLEDHPLVLSHTRVWKEGVKVTRADLSEHRKEATNDVAMIAMKLIECGNKILWNNHSKLKAQLKVLLLEKQGSRCKICGSTEKRFALDHDHQTGVIRGVLCTRCNLALGVLETTPKELMTKMLHYSASEGDIDMDGVEGA